MPVSHSSIQAGVLIERRRNGGGIRRVVTLVIEIEIDHRMEEFYIKSHVKVHPLFSRAMGAEAAEKARLIEEFKQRKREASENRARAIHDYRPSPVSTNFISFYL